MTNSNGLSPAEKSLQALHDHKVSVVRLQDELDSLIKIFSHLRECFENEMMDGLGYLKKGVPIGLMKQGTELTKMMTAVVDSKIRFDKAAKAMADLMTPEDEWAACLKFVQSMTPEDRKSWLNSLRMWMVRRNESYTDQPAG